MSANAKIQAAVEVATSRGIGKLDAAPPAHRLLWALGIQARPPHYAPGWANALLFGGVWGAAMEIALLFVARPLRPDLDPSRLAGLAGMILISAAVFGCVLALLVRARARRAALPDWEAILG